MGLVYTVKLSDRNTDMLKRQQSHLSTSVNSKQAQYDQLVQLIEDKEAQYHKVSSSIERLSSVYEKHATKMAKMIEDILSKQHELKSVRTLIDKGNDELEDIRIQQKQTIDATTRESSNKISQTKDLLAQTLTQLNEKTAQLLKVTSQVEEQMAALETAKQVLYAMDQKTLVAQTNLKQLQIELKKTMDEKGVINLQRTNLMSEVTKFLKDRDDTLLEVKNIKEQVEIEKQNIIIETKKLNSLQSQAKAIEKERFSVSEMRRQLDKKELFIREKYKQANIKYI